MLKCHLRLRRPEPKHDVFVAAAADIIIIMKTITADRIGRVVFVTLLEFRVLIF
jgi:hypothetical protein